MSLHSDDTNQHLTISAPGAASLVTGPFTVAILYQNNAFSSSNLWKAYQSDDYSFANLYIDGSLWYDFASWAGGLDLNASHWRWLIVSKDGVTEPPRVHVAEYAATGSLSWTHADMDSAKPVHGAINRICLGDELGTGLRGDVACIAAFTSKFTDAGIAATFLRSSAAIMSVGPQFFVHWPQAAGVGSSFVDIAGGGVETIRTGTWSASADPTGFDFSLGRSGKPKTWNGSAWVQHEAKVWNGTAWVTHPMTGHNGSEFVVAK